MRDMGRILRTSFGLGALAIVAPMVAHGQVASVAQPETVVDVLHQLSDKADVIFAGQVVAIRRPNNGAVEVEFRVDQAIRGCTAGTPYLLREWAGLWAADDQRYGVGQRLLMLLHAPSSAGMSSPVDGLNGAIPIRQGGASTEIGVPQQPPFVDLRWLGARLPRVVSYRSEPTHAAKAAGVVPQLFTQQQATTGSIVSTANVAPPIVSGSQSAGSVPAQQASVDAVIGMLAAWQKAQHGAP